jgi:hypothetical protein
MEEVVEEKWMRFQVEKAWSTHEAFKIEGVVLLWHTSTEMQCSTES